MSTTNHHYLRPHPSCTFKTPCDQWRLALVGLVISTGLMSASCSKTSDTPQTDNSVATTVNENINNKTSAKTTDFPTGNDHPVAPSDDITNKKTAFDGAQITDGKNGTNDIVTIAKSALLVPNFELYQPSFNLTGTLSAVSVPIAAPATDAQIASKFPAASATPSASSLPDAPAPMLQLVGKLPLAAAKHLRVGHPVSFQIAEQPMTLNGQVSQLLPDPATSSLTLSAVLTASSLENASQHVSPQVGMPARMSIEYGALAKAVRLPAAALHGADLSSLDAKHTRPSYPIPASVWIIGQDQKLRQQVAYVVQYLPSSNQYLVSGITNNGLICLENLPTSWEGLPVKVL